MGQGVVRVTLLVYLRRNEGLSQAQLAARAGLKRGTLLDIERGRINPRTHELERLAAALRVHPPAALLQQVEVTWPACHLPGGIEAMTR
ncbi:MAG: helix-turn-helix transcriptional regulator [Acidobacteria bacterium]|nr:helix-turn-helix transcriptional regulator [Acidobacteriota bacterium]